VSELFDELPLPGARAIFSTRNGGVSDGPYRHIRHPIYTAIIAIALGTTLVFRSYLLLGVAGLSIVAHLWWAAAEEKLLGSPEGLGDAYRTYASHTGRFLPRVRRTRRPTGAL
jgi:protein-S-isoprenylcysteine O-methyltransferase Ste14